MSSEYARSFASRCHAAGFADVTLLCLLLLGSSYVIRLNQQGREALAHVKAEMRADHIPVDLSAWRQKQLTAIKPADNAAPLDRRAIAIAHKVTIYIMNHPHEANTDLPFITIVDPPKACRQFAPKLTVEMDKFVAAHKRFYKLMRRAAARPRAVYRLTRTDRRRPLPQYLAHLGAARDMLAVRSLDAQAHHHSNKAVDILIEMDRLGRSLRNEPGGLPMLLRISNSSKMVFYLQDALSRVSPSVKTLDRMHDALLEGLGYRQVPRDLGLRLAKLYDNARHPQLYTQRAIAVLKQTVRLAQSFHVIIGDVSPSRLNGKLLRVEAPLLRAWVTICPGWVESIKASQAEQQLNCIAPFLASKYPRQICTKRARSGDEVGGEADKCRYLNLIVLDWAEARTSREVAAAAMYVEKYRLVHHHWPKTLAEIQKTPLADAFSASGKPLRYRRTATGVVIYSVGPNGIDDGGHNQPSYYNPSKPHADDRSFRLYNPGLRGSKPAVMHTRAAALKQFNQGLNVLSHHLKPAPSPSRSAATR